MRQHTLYVNYGNCHCVSWATRDVEIYDITDVNTPQLLSDVEIDGRCGEATIENGLLYVASGFNAKDNSAEVGEFGYGTGNGLTIYDVSNPLKPILLSVVKCDGSLFASGYDDWSVRVKNGYAYFTSAYDGVYIYDVSDADNPIRVKHVTVPLYKGRKNLSGREMSTENRKMNGWSRSNGCVPRKIKFSCL